ncbi:hypothetical protein DFP83_101481 [Idiomarina fontislapidosi]|uniref:RepB-like DNA primase domain-containing protein n=1 Tax=Idiomarina fontislapidosi TaxID=263723 RepID=A0A432YBU3_9GAMM|nr:hypothetical protein [Idiomarina fontislapidosi]PYE35592.1 hypothetical protein DFP83_101481 [Idiomarina fontislapidosi]RUO58465.1 hypothetical protein CWE25_02420 [Idiomarina fontislapidosi]
MINQKKAPAGTEAMQSNTNTSIENIPLCSGFGQYHSQTAQKNPQDYTRVSLAEIALMLEKPPAVDKANGQWVIFSSLASRVHKDQLERGLFYALWADIDEPQKIGFDNAFTRLAGNLEIEIMGYTSKSATKTHQKARFIFPLAQPVSGRDFVIMQKILNDKIEALGIIPDRVTERAGQLCFLPNAGSLYLWNHEPFYPEVSPDLWGNEIAAEYEAIEAAENARKARLEASRINASKRMASGEKSPVNAFLAEYDWRDLWPKYGAQQIGKRFLSPYSASQNAAINELPDDPSKWVSHHGSDIANGVGRLSAAGDTCFGDAFDLFVHFEHGGDYDAALKAAGAMFTDASGVTITKQNQRNFMAEQEPADVSDLFEQEPYEDAPNAAQVDLLNPPGLAGDICELIRVKARREAPELYPLAALHLMALVGRDKRSVYTDKLNLITLGIAPTAAGKEAPQSTIKQLANDVYCSNLIHGSAGSFKDMIQNLIDGDGASLYTVDEIHSLLSSMKSANAATYETKMEAEILVMSTTELYTFRGIEKRDLIRAYTVQLEKLEAKLDKASEETDEHRKLSRALEKLKRKIEYIKNGWPNPFFSIMGHSVPERMDAFANAENIASGFLGRSIVVRCSEQRRKLKRGKRNPLESASLMAGITFTLEQVRGIHGTIDATDEAHYFIEQCIDYYEEDERLNHHIVGGIYARAPEQLMKVASILGLDGGMITIEHARYAHALVEQSIHNVRYLMLKAYAETADATENQIMLSAKETVLKNCKGSGITPSQLKQLITRPKSFKRLQDKNCKRDYAQELLDRMVEAGELELFEDGRRTRYRSKAVV